MQLFYNPHITKDTEQIHFEKDESRHIVKVLRKKENDVLKITNGHGFLFDAEIIIASDKKCVANIVNIVEKKRTRDYYLHIAIAPTKNNDRLEWFLEKATEIGIDEITPIICKNSERKVVKTERLSKIIQSAMKQSLQFTLPKLNDPVKFSDFIENDFNGQLFVAHCEDGMVMKHLKTEVLPNASYTILIGPEGDFSTNEISRSIEKKFSPISLGPNRLRTETAGVTVTQSIAFIHQ